MQTSETIAKIAAAMVKAQAAMTGVKKDAENAAFRAGGKVSTYATLAACVDASREALADNGLCVIQGPGLTNTEAKTLTITTRILHESGEWIETAFEMPLTKWSPHEAGSATTYGRRFALMAMLGLAPVDDDDGNAAAGAKPQATKQEDTHGPDWPGLVDPSKIASNAAKKDEALCGKFRDVRSKLDFAPTLPELEKLIEEVTPTVATFPETWRRVLWGEYAAVKQELESAD